MCHRRFSTSICLLVFLSSVSFHSATAQRRDTTIWPQVHADRTVSFRLRAPEAQHVLLNANFLPQPSAMTKDAEGMWSITSGPLAPEIYEYDFTVDGLTIVDPVNPSVKVWRRAARNMVLVPGDPPMCFEEQDVPRGTVHVQRYHSKSLDVTRGLYVYTPPGYETATKTKYPVLYLLHGGGDTEDAWTIVGRANAILDNAIAAGRARPMIVAMPYGHTPGAGRGNRGAFEADLIGDVIPLVEKNYRVRADSADRAIVGLSMGGGQSLRIGLGHPDLFAWIGAFSSSAPSAEELGKLLAKPEELNEKLKLLWIGCGRKDFLFERNQQFRRGLEAKGVKYTAHITDGGHEWRLWRHYLNEILPLLFQSGR
jgi:enterochelin esterase-like enzyme